jgi:hypothetical protein
MSNNPSQEVYNITAQYNQAIWPIIILVSVLAIVIIILAIIKPGKYNKIIALILALESFWLGIVYWLIVSFQQDPAASSIIGVLWIIIGVVFLYIGVYKEGLSFKFTGDSSSIIGAIFMVYALVGYPILQMMYGQFYPAMLLFGGAPCPFTIFTFGLILWTDKKVPIILPLLLLIYAIPVGFLATFLYQIWVDLALIPVSIIGLILIYYRNSKKFSD